MFNVYLDDMRVGPDFTVVGWENWVVVRSVENAKILLEKGLVDNMSLDHDMGTGDNNRLLPTGYDLVCWMEEKNIWPKGKIYLHTASPTGYAKMTAALERNNKLI